LSGLIPSSFPNPSQWCNLLQNNFSCPIPPSLPTDCKQGLTCH